MTVELKPRGETCDLACAYCYEQPMRDAGNFTSGYDLAAMKRALEQEGQRFTLFGGEPLLTPRADLEELLRWGHEQWGGSNIQTNGARLEPWHVELFARFNVSVGMSIDGPGELNDARWAGSLEKTRAATAASLRAIDLLIAAGRPPGLIVTLSRINAGADRLPRLLDWFADLDRRGIRSVNLHLLEVDSQAARDRLALTEPENIAALLACYEVQRGFAQLRFSTLDNLVGLLKGDGANECVWGGCDPLTTPAVHGVDATGQRTNCGRTNKDGIDWTKADTWAPTRTQLLYQTPYDDGGCQGCRFFLACRGQCPGTALDGDWRNRTEHCGVWLALFEQVEADLLKEGVVPLTWPTRKAERLALEQQLLTGEHGGPQEHGDHWDATPAPARENGFSDPAAQDDAHAMVLGRLALSPARGLVVDLGCGNGLLASRVSAAFGVPVVGIEADASKIRLPWVLHGDLAHVDRLLAGYAVDTFLVSARRFEEHPDLEGWCRSRGRQLVIYSYDAPQFARTEVNHA